MSLGFHVVARTAPQTFPLLDRNACVDLWRRLRNAFPRVAACVLMPNHLHLLCLKGRSDKIRWTLGVELRAWTQKFHPGSRIWQPVPSPDHIPDLKHLRRQIRYVHLNPCRSGLASDPLSWEWSTHRDVLGCVVEPWPDTAILSEAFGTSASRLGEKMHRYVSADPTVRVEGTPPIHRYRPDVPLSINAKLLLRACAVARREQ